MNLLSVDVVLLSHVFELKINFKMLTCIQFSSKANCGKVFVYKSYKDKNCTNKFNLSMRCYVTITIFYLSS
jgi:hypothetical protein